jgi:hypothetical protein
MKAVPAECADHRRYERERLVIGPNFIRRRRVPTARARDEIPRRLGEVVTWRTHAVFGVEGKKRRTSHSSSHHPGSGG